MSALPLTAVADATERSLPRSVRELAERLGASSEARLSTVTLTQSGAMLAHPGAREMVFKARQTIALQRSAFEWRATSGPFGCFSVVDAFVDGEGVLDVRLFRLLRLTHMRGGPVIAKGEIMRYLAELALAPDAILRNASLGWSVRDERTISVAAGVGEARGEVELQLDDDGRIGAITATGRPRQEGKRTVERPWSGRFSDYRRHHGRWLPFAAEVAWTLDGGTFVYFRGAMASWSVA